MVTEFYIITYKMSLDVAKSWVLYAVRAALEDEDIRQLVLQKFLYDVSSDLNIGKTFTNEYNTQKLYKYLHTITKSLKPVLFTASNLPDIETGETHFQSYIVDNKQKTLLMIDPSRNYKSGESLYERYVTDYVVKPYFEKLGYRLNWLKTNYTCQTNFEDVFCQTWTLYLQIQSIKLDDDKIKIPRSQEKRYELLLKFFKTIATRVPEFCKRIESIYNYEIQNNPVLVEGIPKSQHLTLRNDLKRYGSPCTILLNTSVSDMYE